MGFADRKKDFTKTLYVACDMGETEPCDLASRTLTEAVRSLEGRGLIAVYECVGFKRVNPKVSDEK